MLLRNYSKQNTHNEKKSQFIFILFLTTPSYSAHLFLVRLENTHEELQNYLLLLFGNSKFLDTSHMFSDRNKPFIIIIFYYNCNVLHV